MASSSSNTVNDAEIASEAYVTLVTSDSYVVGALVLGHSLRRQHTKRALVCMVTLTVEAQKR